MKIINSSEKYTKYPGEKLSGSPSSKAAMTLFAKHYNKKESKDELSQDFQGSLSSLIPELMSEKKLPPSISDLKKQEHKQVDTTHDTEIKIDPTFSPKYRKVFDILISTPTGKEIYKDLLERRPKIEVLTEEVKKEYDQKDAIGLASYEDNIIWLDPSLNDFGAATVLAHEAEHVLKNIKHNDPDIERFTREMYAFIAESIVYDQLQSEYRYRPEWLTKSKEHKKHLTKFETVLHHYNTKELEEYIITRYKLDPKKSYPKIPY